MTSYETLQPLEKDVSEFYSTHIEPMLDSRNVAYKKYRARCDGTDEDRQIHAGGNNYCSHR